MKGWKGAVVVLGMGLGLLGCEAQPKASASSEGCVEACVQSRQMEARAAEAIRADCERECGANPGAYPVSP